MAACSSLDLDDLSSLDFDLRSMDLVLSLNSTDSSLDLDVLTSLDLDLRSMDLVMMPLDPSNDILRFRCPSVWGFVDPL